jgi:hypothetical protein
MTMFQRMIWFFKHLFSDHVCKNFSPWEKHKSICSRAAFGDEILAGHRVIRYSKVWQERRCLDCGWVYQQLLEHGGPIKE